jgi:hypothetical protein
VRSVARHSLTGWEADPVAELYKVNSVDLATYLYSMQGVSGSVGAPIVRGGDYEVTRRDGAISGARWAGPRVLSIRGTLLGNNGATLVPADARARYLDRARALGALLWNDGLDYVVERTIPRQSGGDLVTESLGRYLGGFDPEDVAAHAGRVAFDLLLHDPFWYSTSDTTVSGITGSSSPSVIGDVSTKRVTLTFSGVTATQRLTNNTTGEWIEVGGNSGAPTVVDCDDFTAIRSSVSVIGTVNHAPAFESWLSLRPGTNSLTLTGGGSVDIAYRGAFL